LTIDPLPIRSLLFVPANREDRMHKALTVGADGIVLDLESAIPRGEATVARRMVGDLLDGHRASRPCVFVRVSEIDSDDFAPDLEACMRPGLSGVMLPQVTSARDVERAAAAMDRLDPEGRIVLLPLVETARAVREAYEIASASPRVAYFGGGVSRGGDIARSIGFRWTPQGNESLFIRSKVLIDSRAAGIFNPISGIWGIVDDLDGLRAFATQARDIGYEGLQCIHPSHVPILHEIFTPSDAEIANWRAIIAAMDEAERQGSAAIRLDGRLIDVAHVKTARQDLERARLLGVID
jgi:citrate lyase subunit beta / citryl-CoA lyase